MASTLNAGNLMLYARQAVGASSNMSLNAAQCRALGINTAFIVLTLIVMCMRMWARLVVTKALGTDDVVMLAGTVFTVSLSIAIMIAVVRGIGKIRAEIATDEWEPMLSAFWVSRLLYAVAMLLVKVALLLFYLRLDNRKMMRWSVYGLMVLVAGMGIAHLVVAVVECVPIAIFWTSRADPLLYAKHCMSPAMQQSFWDAAGSIVIITDICLWLCPLPMIWSLQLPLRQKWAVSAIFAFGAVSIAAACVRFYYVRQLANEPELYRQLADSLIWYALELHIAIFCGCSSALKVFFKRYFPAILGSSSSKAKYPLGSYGNDRSRINSHPLTSLSSKIVKNQTVISSSARSGMGEAGRSNESRNDSEEAIMAGDRGIRLKTELQQEVTRTSVESDDKSAEGHPKGKTLVRSFVK